MIVLDTHVLVWWLSGNEPLSEPARDVIDAERASPDGRVLVSAISAWEIAMLVERGRLVLTMDVEEWLETAAAVEGVQFVPVSREVAMRSVRLPANFHADPADRMITALARHYSVPLVTADRKIQEYGHVRTIW